jgi:hypothetical protein
MASFLHRVREVTKLELENAPDVGDIPSGSDYIETFLTRMATHKWREISCVFVQNEHGQREERRYTVRSPNPNFPLYYVSITFR